MLCVLCMLFHHSALQYIGMSLRFSTVRFSGGKGISCTFSFGTEFGIFLTYGNKVCNKEIFEKRGTYTNWMHENLYKYIK